MALRRLTFTIFILWSGAAGAAEPIEGRWRTPSGDTALVSSCGDAYCIAMLDGQHAGRVIGTLRGRGDRYAGTVSNPLDGKTYQGTASVSAHALNLQGCVLKMFCKTRVFTR